MEDALIDELAELYDKLMRLYRQGTEGLSILDLHTIEKAIRYIAVIEYNFKTEESKHISRPRDRLSN